MQYQVGFPHMHWFTLISTEFHLLFLFPRPSIAWNCSEHLTKPLFFHYFSLRQWRHSLHHHSLYYKDIEQPRTSASFQRSPVTSLHWAAQSFILARFLPLNNTFILVKNFHLSQISFSRKFWGGAMLKEVKNWGRGERRDNESLPFLYLPLSLTQTHASVTICHENNLSEDYCIFWFGKWSFLNSMVPSFCYMIILTALTKSPSVISLIHPLKNCFTRRKLPLGMEKNICSKVRINWKINCIMDACGGTEWNIRGVLLSLSTASNPYKPPTHRDKEKCYINIKTLFIVTTGNTSSCALQLK